MKTLLNINQVNSIINDTYTSDMITVSPRGHYSSLLGKIKFMPTTKAQALRQIRHINSIGYDNLLMVGEYRSVEIFLNEFGFSGQYTLTKSQTMCRLENISAYVSALKNKFDI